MSPAGSPAAIDERLARLAPTTSPDPERLDAARAALDAVVDGTDDGTGPSRSRRVGGAHVLDLDEARARHDDGDGVPVPLLDDDVVVPLGRGRTARERRRSRVQLGAAAAGVVGIVAVGLVLAPRPAPEPAAPSPASPAMCVASLTDSAPTGEAEPDPVWRTLAHESRDGADTMLLRSRTTGFTGFCGYRTDAAGSTATSNLWTDGMPAEPGGGEVAVGGVLDDDWYVAWGLATDDVTSLRLLGEPSADERSQDSGFVVDVGRDGADWSVVLRGDEVPADTRLSLAWQTTDGTERSMPLDSAWPQDGDPTTSLTEARRDACTDALPKLRPVIEKRYDDLGLTVAVGGGQVVACMQDAAPPFGSANTMSGPEDDQEPAPDEAFSVFGGSADDARTMVGRAGDDVVRAEVLVADGTVIEAEVSDGYWAAWSATTSEEDWEDAQLVWYLEDGSRHDRRLLG